MQTNQKPQNQINATCLPVKTETKGHKPLRQNYEIRDKVKQVKFYYWKKYAAEHLARNPSNCAYNKEIILPDKNDHKIRVCTYNSCYDSCFKKEHADKCNVFTLAKNKEDLKKDFNQILKDSDYVKQNFKDLTALTWVLGLEANSTKKPNIFVRLWRKIFN